jgi:hypothetical protein
LVILFWIEAKSAWRESIGVGEKPQKFVHVELEKIARVNMGMRV